MLPQEHLYFVSYCFSFGLIKTSYVQAYATSSRTPSSLIHSITTISLRYLPPLRSIIAPSIHSFIRRASGFAQHACEARSGFKYLRHSISRLAQVCNLCSTIFISQAAMIFYWPCKFNLQEKHIFSL